MKIRKFGAEVFHENGEKEGQTDTTKLTAAFRDFAKST